MPSHIFLQLSADPHARAVAILYLWQFNPYGKTLYHQHDSRAFQCYLVYITPLGWDKQAGANRAEYYTAYCRNG